MTNGLENLFMGLWIKCMLFESFAHFLIELLELLLSGICYSHILLLTFLCKIFVNIYFFLFDEILGTGIAGHRADVRLDQRN